MFRGILCSLVGLIFASAIVACSSTTTPPGSESSGPADRNSVDGGGTIKASLLEKSCTPGCDEGDDGYCANTSPNDICAGGYCAGNFSGDESVAHCSTRCEDAECPDGYTCREVPIQGLSGVEKGKVCFRGVDGNDEGPKEDAIKTTTDVGPSMHLMRDLDIPLTMVDGSYKRNCSVGCRAAKMQCKEGLDTWYPWAWDLAPTHADYFSNYVNKLGSLNVIANTSSGRPRLLPLDRCDTGISDSYYMDGITYRPGKANCICDAPTTLLTTKVARSCDDICKSKGLACDGTVYWPKANDPQKAIGGGKARYAPKGYNEGESNELDELIIQNYFLACGDAPKVTMKDDDLKADYSLLSIGCACK